jgi:putative flippase GtrA
MLNGMDVRNGVVPDGRLRSWRGAEGLFNGRVRRLVAEVAGFAVVGAAAYATDLSVFGWLRAGEHWSPLPAKALSAALACVVAYLGNRYGPYRRRTGTGGVRTLAPFLVLQFVAALIQLGCLLTSHYVLGFTSARADLWAGGIAGMGLATAVRFWGTRTLVFRAGT